MKNYFSLSTIHFSLYFCPYKHQRIGKLKKKTLILVICALYSGLGVAQSAHWGLMQAQSAYQSKNYKAAEKAYAAIKNSPKAAYNCGNAVLHQGKNQEAVDYYMRAAGQYKNPADKSDAYFNAGNALMAMGSYVEAVEAYQKSLIMAPGRPDAKKNLAIARRNVPPPPETTPPPPPPPPPPPQKTYLDQARRSQESLPAPLSPDAARQILESAVAPVEEESAKRYRHLSPSNRPTRSKKAW